MQKMGQCARNGDTRSLKVMVMVMVMVPVLFVFLADARGLTRGRSVYECGRDCAYRAYRFQSTVSCQMGIWSFGGQGYRGFHGDRVHVIHVSSPIEQR
jgi:hypothetical protein